jgi:hypothetical protein
MIHVGSELLSCAIAVEAKSLVQANQTERSHGFGKMWPQPAKEVGCQIGIVPHDPVLVTICRVVRGKRRAPAFDAADEVAALLGRVDRFNCPEETLVLESEWQLE